MKIAIIGSGIAGNVVAHHLHREHEITLYEAGGHVGGHTHTHIVEQAGRSYRVDTGFVVFNRLTYPNFIALLDELGVESQESSMSFSVRCESSGLEYNGTTVNSLFAQRRNLLRPAFLGMIRDILRFNREAPALLREPGGEMPLGEFLARGRYGRTFVDYYIVPMAAAIWSTDPQSIFSFPVRFFIRFFYNHGMLTVNDRPVWRTVRGGAASYVEKLIAPFRDRIRLNTPVEWMRRLPGSVILKARGLEPQYYDAAFLACHSDQALRILPGRPERIGAGRARRDPLSDQRSRSAFGYANIAPQATRARGMELPRARGERPSAGGIDLRHERPAEARCAHAVSRHAQPERCHQSGGAASSSECSISTRSIRPPRSLRRRGSASSTGSWARTTAARGGATGFTRTGSRARSRRSVISARIMHSALYIGRLRHRRFAPLPHAFAYRVCMAWIDLEELDEVFRGRLFWSTRRPALAWMKRSDYLGNPAHPLERSVRDLV